MLQIKNTLGGGKPEGSYVWKKYEIGTSYIEKTTQHETQSNGIVITKGLTFNSNMTVKVMRATSYTFDSATGKYTLKNNISSFDVVSGVASGSTSYSTALNGYYFMLGDDTEADYMYKGCDSYSIGFTNNGDGTCKMWEQYVGNPIYAYSADTEPTYTFLDYIVSDKETAYPDGGEKGGYYYEKVGGGLTPEMFGCTKMAVDNFVFASNDEIGTLNHSLGEKPKFSFLIFNGENVTGGSNRVYVAIGSAYIDTDGTSFFVFESQGRTTGSGYGEFKETETTVTFSQSYFYYNVGEYTLITMA